MTTKSPIPLADSAGHSKKPKTPRPVGRPTQVNDSVRAAVVFLHRDLGVGKRKVASRIGLGVGTIFKILAES
jgi:hypothetical protein